MRTIGSLIRGSLGGKRLVAGTNEESGAIIMVITTATKKDQLTFILGLLCATYHYKCFAYIISFISLSILKGMILFLLINSIRQRQLGTHRGQSVPQR